MMPPACPGEIHACSYKRRDENFWDATGLSGGGSRLLLTKAANRLSDNQQA
jgi:hypothetical protein